MLSLNKQLVESRVSHEQTLLQRQIEATDKQIDRLVIRALWADGGEDWYCGGEYMLKDSYSDGNKLFMDLIYLDYNCFQEDFKILAA